MMDIRDDPDVPDISVAGVRASSEEAKAVFFARDWRTIAIPAGTKIQAGESPDGFILRGPRNAEANPSNKISGIAFSLFASTWLGFCFLFLLGLIFGGGDFIALLFFLPFLLIGLFMANAGLNAIFGRAELVIGRDEVKLSKGFLLFHRRLRAPLSILEAARIGKPVKAKASSAVIIPRQGDLELVFGEDLGREELSYAAALINAIIGSRLSADPRA